MAQLLSNFLLNRFSEYMASRIGLSFPQDRWDDMEGAISKCAVELGFKNAKDCIENLPSSELTKSQIEILASHLTIGETYFFRDSASFEVLERHVLPELIAKRRATDRRIRIWSAGCCTGEEPYSIAMLLTRLIPDFKDWNISILATDINPHFLHKAAVGIYGEWSFRETPADVRKMFFREIKKGYFELSSQIRSLVTFAHLNLAEDVYPSIYKYTNAMDIIFCRNVTMYFQPAQAQRVIASLATSLLNDGWLFLSAVETIVSKFPKLETVYFPKAILYRKTNDDSINWSYPFRDLSSDESKTYEENLPELSSDFIDELPILEHDDLSKDEKIVMEIARNCANEGQLDKAMEWCEKLIDIDKLNPSAWYLYATICEEQGRLHDAIAGFRKTLFLDQDYVLAHLSIGNCVRRTGDLEGSERHFAAALATLNKYPEEYLLPETEGLRAGHLKEIIQTTMRDANDF